MTHKFNINQDIRTFYVSTEGNDVESGLSLENSKKTITAAIAAVNALSPPSSLANPTAILAIGAGVFTEPNLDFPLACQFDGPLITNAPATGNCFEPAGLAAFAATVAVATAANSIAIRVNDRNKVGVTIQAIQANGDDSVGVHLLGMSNQSLIVAAQIDLTGLRAVGILDETDNVNPEVSEVSFVTLQANDTCAFRHNPSSSTSRSVFNIGTIVEIGSPTGTKGIEIIEGDVDCFADSIQAASAIIVEDGAILNIACECVRGDIIVNSGGTLNCEITRHATGTITNNGTINGIIGTATFGLIHQLGQFNANDANFPATDPAAADSRNAHPIIVFDDTTAENVIFNDVMSREYSGENISVDIDWVAATAITGGVTWGIEFERTVPGSQDIDSDSFAAQQIGTSTTNGTSGVVTRTTIILTQAQADAIAAGDVYRLRLERVAADGGDTMLDDAQVLRVIVRQ